MRLIRYVRSFLINSILAVASILFSLLLLEVALRFSGVQYDYAYSIGIFESLYHRLHSTGGHIWDGNWVVGFKIDPLRDKEVTVGDRVVQVVKEPNQTRILFVGDSGTEGFRVRIRNSFPSKFRESLTKQFPNNPPTVINAGVLGMSPVDEYFILGRELWKLHPDLVVMGLFLANDINFILEHESQRIKYGLNTLNHDSTPGFLKSLAAQSVLIRFVYVKTLALDVRYNIFDKFDFIDKRLIPKESRLKDEYGFRMLDYLQGEVATYQKKPSRLIKRAYRVLEQVLSQVKELSRKHDFSLKIVLLPSSSAVSNQLDMFRFPNAIEELRDAGIKVEEKHLDFAKPTRIILEICRKIEIDCIDPTLDLRNSKSKVFVERDDHFSVKGHEVVAKRLFDELGAEIKRLVRTKTPT